MSNFKIDPVVAAQAVGILITNLPAAIQTGEEVLRFIEAGIEHLRQIWSTDTAPMTAEDVQKILDKETLQAIHIASQK